MTGLDGALDRYLDSASVPAFGAVAGIWSRGALAESAAAGYALAYGAVDREPELLPEAERSRMSLDTRFDVASLTKLFTATLAMTLLDDGALSLDTPVGDVLPEFATGERRAVTLRTLLTHTSGLPAEYPLWKVEAPERVATMLSLPLESKAGEVFRYSCVGYVTAGILMERITGMPLRELLESRLVGPLGLTATGYGPHPDAEDIAATEFQPWTGRGIIRGEVHDETAWALGGAAGNAGLFSTLADLGRFAELFHGGGIIAGQRILSAASVEAMVSGIGFRPDDPDFMGELAEGGIGHTGFTGTSLVIDRGRHLTVVVLSNRVHPTRQGTDVSTLRREVAGLAMRA